MYYSELKNKEVINVCNCKKLGKIIDFEFDECTGKICKLVIGRCGKWFNVFVPEEETIVPFCDIKQIGPDLICVEVRCGRR